MAKIHTITSGNIKVMIDTAGYDYKKELDKIDKEMYVGTKEDIRLMKLGHKYDAMRMADLSDEQMISEFGSRGILEEAKGASRVYQKKLDNFFDSGEFIKSAIACGAYEDFGRDE